MKKFGLFILIVSFIVGGLIFFLKKNEHPTNRTPITATPNPNIRVRVRCTLPNGVPDAIEASIWNPETMPSATSDCTRRGNLRSLECAWIQPRIEPVVYQARYDFARSIRVVDQQNNTFTSGITHTQWSCTQVDNRTEFDQFGTCEVWVDDVRQSAHMVDNGAHGLDGSRCKNGCNFAVSGDFAQPPDRCIR